MPGIARTSALPVLWLMLAQAGAAPWEFSPPLEVSRVHGERIFHHLGSGGRNGIAASESNVGLVWEDNRDGEIRCYLGWRGQSETAFTEARFSLEDACYEPTVAILPDGQFAVAWEENDAVWIRVAGEGGLGAPLKLSTDRAGQIAITALAEGGLVAAWAQQAGHYKRILVAQLERDGPLGLKLAHREPAEKTSLAGDQAYPEILALNGGELVLAWEDRRKGHTIILAASGELPPSFAEPQQINESFWKGRALGYGRGTGAMRVGLASPDGKQVLAVWADKRNFRSGYDVFAAERDAGAESFGANEKVQDGFADLVAQWHPDVAAGRIGNDSLAVAVWDDDREGTPDIWLSWRIDGTWSDDLDVPGASGGGVQVDPAVALDPAGRLHLAWVEKADIDGPSRIRYLSATPDPIAAPNRGKR